MIELPQEKKLSDLKRERDAARARLRRDMALFRGRLEPIGGELAQATRENPVTALGVAVAVGAAVGYLMPAPVRMALRIQSIRLAGNLISDALTQLGAGEAVAEAAQAAAETSESV